ncbi:MAG: 50S ribosomal protein L20 [Candidatus Kerfeldbacteria bacterium]|nr:50S ribosomal protein L20 [Candidatus Kerfeldbacteria bacterium]
MPRVKRGTTHVRRRKTLLKRAKGFRLGRRKTIRLGRVAVIKSGVHAYQGRKLKKRTRRGEWNISINAAVREHGLSYSKFMNGLKRSGITLDRKVLSQLAKQHPAVFAELVKAVNA